MLYGCDGHWWKRNNGVPEFAGLKISADAAACGLYRDLCKVTIPDENSTLLQVATPGIIASGGNSGFQAINLAVQFGVRRILLIGFDMHMAKGVHWHGDHGRGLNNPRDSNFVNWRNNLNGRCAQRLSDLGVEVINASADSALTAYPKMSIEEVVERWEL